METLEVYANFVASKINKETNLDVTGQHDKMAKGLMKQVIDNTINCIKNAMVERGIDVKNIEVKKHDNERYDFVSAPFEMKEAFFDTIRLEGTIYVRTKGDITSVEVEVLAAFDYKYGKNNITLGYYGVVEATEKLKAGDFTGFHRLD